MDEGGWQIDSLSISEKVLESKTDSIPNLHTAQCFGHKIFFGRKNVLCASFAKRNNCLTLVVHETLSSDLEQVVQILQSVLAMNHTWMTE